MSSRRLFRLAWVLVFLVLVSTPVFAAKVNLKFSMWMSATGSANTELDMQLDLLKKYMTLNPNVSIELYQQGWSGYHEKLLTMAAGGVAPDVMVLSRLQVPAFVDAGVIQTIDPWFNRESAEFRRDIVEVVSGTYNGRLYGIPIWGGPSLYEYNADLFAQAGTPQPADLARKKEWTWDKFLELGKKITRDTNGDNKPEVFMHSHLSATNQQDWYAKLRAFGGDVLTSEGKPFTNVNVIEKGLQFWADLVHQSHIAPTSQEPSDFLKGTEATYFNWISNLPNRSKLVANSFKMEMTTPPTGPAGPFALVGGCPMAVSAASQNAEEAYKFARWYAVESQHWKLRGSPPTWTDMKRDYRSYLTTMFSWPEAVVEAMSGAISMEPGVGKYYNDLNNAWSSSLKALAGGTMAPREAASRIVADSQRILGTGK